MKNFILGTANFSNNYGVLYPRKIESLGLENLINFAQNNGINHFDTAKSYEDAEEKLGKYLNKSQPIIVDSKINTKECGSLESIVDAVEESIHKIGVKSLDTLYLHHHDLILGNNSKTVMSGLEKVLGLGLAKNLGISVYTQKDLLDCKKIFPLLTRFQILENICDRRLINSQEMMKIAESGNQINVRSIFLQGILLAQPKNLPNNLNGARGAVKKLNLYSQNHKVSTMNLCIAYAYSIRWVTKIVVGVDSLNQLKEIINSKYVLPSGWETEIPVLPNTLIDPRFW